MLIIINLIMNISFSSDFSGFEDFLGFNNLTVQNWLFAYFSQQKYKLFTTREIPNLTGSILASSINDEECMRLETRCFSCTNAIIELNWEIMIETETGRVNAFFFSTQRHICLLNWFIVSCIFGMRVGLFGSVFRCVYAWSSPSSGWSLSEVHKVRLSRRSCMIKVESL